MRPAPRARAVADLPVDRLLARSGELARGWATALILTRPVERIAEIPLEEIARDGPSLCEQALRSLQGDAELDRLLDADGRSGGPSPARRLGALAGAGDAPSIVRGAEALRGILWEAVAGELHEPSARQLADACDRLAYVCSAVSAVAIAEIGPEAESPEHATEPIVVGGGGGVAASAVVAAGDRGGAVIVDEGAGALEHQRQGSVASPRVEEAEIEIRDQRPGEGPGAWIGSITRELERFRRDGVAFAVVLVEIAGLARRSERLTAEIERALRAEIERALRAEVGAQRPPGRGTHDPGGDSAAGAADSQDGGSLTREHPGRYWLLAPRTDRPGAQELAERLARALARMRSEEGRPLEVAVGTAICPGDGNVAATLAAHADVGVYAARAAARLAGARAGAPVDGE